ncbi:MAG TPA: hypothetical protein VFU31_12240 [Candidatus Binatia bacterium]|nr:hypothetical protein [Candidatus Binatia bacterium]
MGILLGPAVGGATMLLFGPPIGLFINALMFAPMIIFMFILPYTGHGRDEGSSAGPGRFSLGIHWSLAISAVLLLAVTIALFALVIPGRGAEDLN